MKITKQQRKAARKFKERRTLRRIEVEASKPPRGEPRRRVLRNSELVEVEPCCQPPLPETLQLTISAA